jgi:hypothetical protein
MIVDDAGYMIVNELALTPRGRWIESAFPAGPADLINRAHASRSVRAGILVSPNSAK